jgi:hypothetical protein
MCAGLSLICLPAVVKSLPSFITCMLAILKSSIADSDTTCEQPTMSIHGPVNLASWVSAAPGGRGLLAHI